MGILGRVTAAGVKYGVKAAQYLIVSYGIDVAIDGIWGKITQTEYYKLKFGEKKAVDNAAVAAGLPIEVVQSLQANPREILDVELEVASAGPLNGVDGASLANLMAIIAAESGFKIVAEDHRHSLASARLNFSAARSMSEKQIDQLVAGGPAVFFEAMYGVGTEKARDLGNVSKGDGGKYYGRGLFQLTGLSVYKAFERDSGWPVVARPDLLLKPEVSITSAFWYWKTFVMSRKADRSVVSAIKVVNSGLIDRRGEVAKRVKLAAMYQKLV